MRSIFVQISVEKIRRKERDDCNCMVKMWELREEAQVRLVGGITFHSEIRALYSYKRLNLAWYTFVPCQSVTYHRRLACEYDRRTIWIYRLTRVANAISRGIECVLDRAPADLIPPRSRWHKHPAQMPIPM